MDIQAGKKVVLFDGLCNLCSAAVQFIIRHDKKNRFVFASLQSPVAAALLGKFDRSAAAMDSFLLIDAGRLYTYSSAAIRLTKYLAGGWILCYALIIIPKFLRDPLYRYIAGRRYKWFGKKTVCWVPNPELQEKFLDLLPPS
jgi:predicted DCC family thiol-disulfide oxidoreductase YuxK